MRRGAAGRAVEVWKFLNTVVQVDLVYKRVFLLPFGTLTDRAGAMDSVSDFESGGCRFKSCARCFFEMESFCVFHQVFCIKKDPQTPREAPFFGQWSDEANRGNARWARRCGHVTLVSLVSDWRVPPPALALLRRLSLVTHSSRSEQPTRNCREGGQRGRQRKEPRPGTCWNQGPK